MGEWVDGMYSECMYVGMYSSNCKYRDKIRRVMANNRQVELATRIK